MKRAFIVHCMQGTPEDFWYPWLKKELEKSGFVVQVPEMPDTNAPTIESWVGKLREGVEEIDDEVFFVGHSIGCQTILRLLEGESGLASLGGVVFVAPWIMLSNLSEEEEAITRPWIESRIDNQKVFRFTGENKLVAIFSTDDPYVPIENAEEFKNRFGARLLIEDGKGHFDDEEMKELPIVMEELRKLIQ